MSRLKSWKPLHISDQVAIYQHPIPPSPFLFPLWDVYTFRFSSPFKRKKSIFLVFSFPHSPFLHSYHILTPISTLTAIYSYPFSRLPLEHILHHSLLVRFLSLYHTRRAQTKRIFWKRTRHKAATTQFATTLGILKLLEHTSVLPYILDSLKPPSRVCIHSL